MVGTGSGSAPHRRRSASRRPPYPPPPPVWGVVNATRRPASKSVSGCTIPLLGASCWSSAWGRVVAAAAASSAWARFTAAAVAAALLSFPAAPLHCPPPLLCAATKGTGERERKIGSCTRSWLGQDGPPKYLSVTTYEGCSTELLRDFYMDNEYRMEWDNTVIKHEQLQCDENSGIEIGRTVKKFPLLTPREYILAWRVWESSEKSFYCLVKECDHSLAPRQRKFVRVRLLRSGWCIRKVPGRDACQITVLHHEDNGMNIEMAKLAFSKGIWSYICKMNSALRHYPQHHGPSISILTMQRLMKMFPQDLKTNMDESRQSPGYTAAAVVPSAHSARTSPCKQLGKKSSRETIASGLLLIGSIVCLSRGRSNLGAQLAMAFFLKKAFKQDKESGSPRGRTDATVSRH